MHPFGPLRTYHILAQQMVPYYLTFGFLSVLGAAAVTFVYLLDSRLHRDHASTLILIMTLMDFLYTLK